MVKVWYKVKVTIVGASGYTGGELLRLLLRHPKVEDIIATSRTYAGKKVSVVHKNLTGIYDKNFSEFDEKKVDSDVVFISTPHGESMEIVPKLIERDIRVIDLSADYRIKDTSIYEKFYCKHKSPELLKESVYGIPEIYREKIKKARLIANPGCYAISAILAIMPLSKFKNKLDIEKVVVDSKSGTSGAGAKISEELHHPEVHDNLRPYNVVEHRHRPEIEFILSNFFDGIKISFTPTLMPISRGILTNVHVFGKIEDIGEQYSKFYNGEPFIRIVDIPEIKNVVGTNYCDLNAYFDKNSSRILAISAIDNLIKGASGNAIQNMNIMFSFDEKSSLELIAEHP